MAALDTVGMGCSLKGWFAPLIEAGVIPPDPRRIIIDIPWDGIVSVYYECDADKRMFTLDLANALTDAEVIGVADVPETT